jgi:predicted nucleic acid-binding protein
MAKGEAGDTSYRTESAITDFASEIQIGNFRKAASSRPRGKTQMTAVYIESSALLAWLFGEPQARSVISSLNRAKSVMTSVLSIVEAERIINRAEGNKMLTAGQAQQVRGMMERAKAGWILMEITEKVRIRAGRLFPVEPVRALDAIHLATALVFMQVFPDLVILSFDNRILENARPLGINIP